MSKLKFRVNCAEIVAMERRRVETGGRPPCNQSANRPKRCVMLGAVVAAVTLLSSGVWAALAPADSSAAQSGWSVSTVPGSGQDDVLLGTACPSGADCIAVGVTLGDLSSGTTVPTPIVDTWNGSSWTYGTGAPLPSGLEGGLFDVTCVNAIRLLGGGDRNRYREEAAIRPARW